MSLIQEPSRGISSSGRILGSRSSSDGFDQGEVVDAVTAFFWFSKSNEQLDFSGLEFSVSAGGNQCVEVLSGDDAFAVGIEAFEGPEDIIRGIHLPHLVGHHGNEFVEGNNSSTAGVAIFDHLAHLSICGFEAQLAHHALQGVLRDLIAVPTEHFVGFFELGNLVL